MQAGLMLPGSVRGDSRREGGRGRERQRERGGRERLHTGGQREFPVYSDEDVWRMLIVIIMAVIANLLLTNTPAQSSTMSCLCFTIIF